MGGPSTRGDSNPETTLALPKGNEGAPKPLPKLMAAVLDTHNLQKVNIEPLGSCWLISVLANIHGALEKHNNLACKERLMDFHVRRGIWQSMLRFVQDTQGGGGGEFHTKKLLDALENLHTMPASLKKRKRAGQKPTMGWAPGGVEAWGGTGADDQTGPALVIHHLFVCQPTS